jgi:hypothetical protein
VKNKYKIEDNTLIVYNKKDNREMLFDAEDFDLIKDYTWRIHSTGYVVANSLKRHGKQKTIRSHNLVMNYNLIDHISLNKLDNRKINLRKATSTINNQNRKAKGYTWNNTVKMWHSSITANKKKIYLGVYKTEAEAREAYLEAKKKYHPSAPQHLFV